jgi:hypothetical protein
MQPERTGVAWLRHDSARRAQVYIRLKSGESCILRTFAREQVMGRPWTYCLPAGDPITIKGNWKLDFVEGGPDLPASVETTQLGSWTAGNEVATKRFAGTARYEIEFDLPPCPGTDWILDLGDVRDSAEVNINGQAVGTLIAAPFSVRVGRYLHPGSNVLDVFVTNVAANRIADMDRRGIQWKIFNDPANVMSIRGKLLEASDWPIRDAGLLGPVRLIPTVTFLTGGVVGGHKLQ